MAPAVADLLKDFVYQPELVERIGFRESEVSVVVVPPQHARWAEEFNRPRARILAALGAKALAVHHTGSTSVPDLPAKDIIDIDLVVPDSVDEPAYVDALEQAGFRFLLREPHWHQHRFFYSYTPLAVNLHAWSPDSPEVARHLIFRERLLHCPADRAVYGEAKQQAARITREDDGTIVDYNVRKEDAVRQILRNAFQELGYIA